MNDKQITEKETSASLHIKSLYPSLRKSEQAVADYILTDIPRLLDQSVQAAARSTGVSEASLMRFAKQLGYSGFRELKLRLAEETGRISQQEATVTVCLSTAEPWATNPHAETFRCVQCHPWANQADFSDIRSWSIKTA
jgi:DNA-binding MurR/RpiR family transcriptional regulator